jgi:hypothetical protein
MSKTLMTLLYVLLSFDSFWFSEFFFQHEEITKNEVLIVSRCRKVLDGVTNDLLTPNELIGHLLSPNPHFRHFAEDNRLFRIYRGYQNMSENEWVRSLNSITHYVRWFFFKIYVYRDKF